MAWKWTRTGRDRHEGWLGSANRSYRTTGTAIKSAVGSAQATEIEKHSEGKGSGLDRIGHTRRPNR